jgi:oligopeptide transport system substrate-binding protein
MVFSTSILLSAPALEASPGSPVFRFSLSTEPSHFDPAKITSSESNYFIVNLLRGLYFIDENGSSKPEIAETCKQINALKIECVVKKIAKWSDGKEIVAEDFVKSWRRLLTPGAKGIGVSILSSVENAIEVHRGKKAATELGVRAKSKRVLEIILNKPDSDFFSKLAHPALSVVRAEAYYSRSEEAPSTPVSGPYKIAQWSKSNRIRITPNGYFDSIRPALKGPRPDAEILIVEDDETALNLYREGTLTFLRRLPTHYLKDWKDSKELFQIPVVRFDYIGFGPQLRNQPDLRKALALSLNYLELKILYSALGIPGCPGISPGWMSKVPCHEFDLEKAKSYFEKVPESVRQTPLTLQFSKLGGDDIQKGMEWAQAQWKKNLGFKVELQSVEQAVFIAGLKTNPPPIFRKGVGLDRATCLAATEIFTAGDGENYIQLNDNKYQAAVEKLASSRTPEARKSICTELVKILMDDANIIPLGQIHFSILAKPSFKGWTLTPLNQLDLSRLQFSK